jgi:hypothetical protein
MYQPLPWLGLTKAGRTTGVATRWDAIRAYTEKIGIRDAVDVGANSGFFTIGLAQQGVNVMAIEGNPRFHRVCLYAIRRLSLDNVSLLFGTVTPANVEMVPTADCILFLAVWHHMVRGYGCDAATRILEALWRRTRQVMFFETGESEMPASYNLPDMRPDPATYLSEYLSNTCKEGNVVHLGLHETVFPDSGKSWKRNLFAVVRSSSNLVNLELGGP